MSATREALTPDKRPVAYQAWADEVGAGRWGKQEQAIAFSAFIAGWYRRTGEGEEEFSRGQTPPPLPPTHAPDYVALATQVGELVTRNQAQYGNAFGRSGDVLRIFYPNGIQPDQYDAMMAITRIIDKQFRIASGNQGEENAYKDLCGYGLLGWARTEQEIPGTYSRADLAAADARVDARHSKLVVG